MDIDLVNVDIPSIYEAPGAWGTIVGISGAAIFFMFVIAGDAERGKIAAFSLVALMASIGFSWEYRRNIWFWGVICSAAIIHALVISLIDWPSERAPAMTFAPITLADTLILTLLIHGVAKLMRN